MDEGKPQSFMFWRSLMIVVAIDVPLAIGTAIYLAVDRNWPWYGSVGAGLCVLWGLPLIWAGWLSMRRTGPE
jgi:ABC-type phosphate transport system permease subunit